VFGICIFGLVMADENKTEEIGLEASLRGVKASREVFAMLLPYIGPHLKWLVYAAAIVLLCWGIGHGISQVWTAKQESPLVSPK